MHDRLLLDQPGTQPSGRLTLLHGSRSVAELPPPEYLDPLLDYARKHPDRLAVHIFVDEFPEKKSALHYDVTHGRIDAQAIRDRLGLPDPRKPSFWKKLWGSRASAHNNTLQPFKREGKVLVSVCGPEP